MHHQRPLFFLANPALFTDFVTGENRTDEPKAHISPLPDSCWLHCHVTAKTSLALFTCNSQFQRGTPCQIVWRKAKQLILFSVLHNSSCTRLKSCDLQVVPKRNEKSRTSWCNSENIHTGDFIQAHRCGNLFGLRTVS